MPRHDNFLAHTVKARQPHITYQDGMRFGFGFFIAGLVVLLVIGGLAWGIVVAFHLG